MIFILFLIGLFGGYVTCKQDGVHLTCNGDSMVVRLDASRLLEDTASPFSVHFIDPSCNEEGNGANTVTIATPYNNCGTFKQVQDASIVYSNRIYFQSTNGENLDILVECEIVRRDFTVGVMSSSSINDLSTSNDNVNDTISEPQVGYGAFYVTMERYTDANFKDKYSNSDLGLGLDQDLFFEVELRDVGDLRLNLESCWATVESASDSKPQYEFISNGCKVDETVVFYNEPTSPAIQRYSFRSFAFRGYNPEVYIHCKVFVCDVESSECIPSCNNSRRRRNANKKSIIARDLRTYQHWSNRH
ncbi:CUB and zona pellucida-like domain-containing protein 1 [Lytechinus variegatus]|uniref:CUB and zona pellucida-like domain-containing protein 1 n=1 Tax=Lytechinus variegatus TaxID=7654 RepID=UPI001BB28B48|nr:CUB and zona pellucida-like domain-containing protein 1 [Lytechinus variegatus]